MSRQLFLIGFIFLFSLVFSLGCSGKTTVKEQLTDTSPRPKTAEENKQTTNQTPPSETTTNEEQKTGGNSGERPAPTPTPTPGTETGGGTTIPPSGGVSGGGKSEQGGGKDARERYYQDNLAYPGGTLDTNMPSEDSPGYTGKTLISKDSPDAVAKWYMDKLGTKASMNQSGSHTSGSTYSISVNDKDSGYTANIFISKVNKNSPTRIIISVKDT